MDQDFGNPLVQNVIALPIDENDEFYYLMHHDFTFDSKDTSSFYLTTIDMKGDNGLGEVINKREVVFTDAISRSGFEITRHNNGVDWWVVVPRYESNCYHVLLLTEDGIVSDDLQCLGTSWNFNDVQGQMDFSPDGSKFARFIYEHGLNIFDFDNEHGLFSNPLRIDFSFTNVFFHAGVFFSPNSRFVYASAFSDVFQYDLAESDVSNSRIKVATLNTPDSIMLNTRFTRGALGPNGKIYIGGSFEFNHLHVIHNPDCKGVQCDVEQYAIKLDEFPNSSALGIPHIPHFRNQPQEIDCDTVSIMTSTSDFEFQIDMSTVVEGIYFYKILDKNNIVANGKLQKISH
jgi:hypothetical protein